MRRMVSGEIVAMQADRNLDEIEELAFVGDADGEFPAPRTFTAWAVRLVYYLFALAEIFVALRVLLKLISANPQSGFTRFIYAVTGPLTAPFRNIVASPTAGNGSTLEISSILAIVVYLLTCWLVVRLVQIVLERPGGRFASTLPDE